MATEIDLVRVKKPFLTNTSFLNKGKVKFLQIKHDTIRQKYLIDCSFLNQKTYKDYRILYSLNYKHWKK